MCSDENGAPYAVHFFNAQLAAFHENAKLCLKKHAEARTEESKHFYALAEFSVQKTGISDPAFFTTFDKPTLEFICNHDAVLHLHLVNPRLVLDSLRPGRTGQDAKLPASLHLTYRLGFETRKIVGNDQKIGNGSSIIELVVLEIQKAVLASAEPEVIVGRELLVRYIAEYFDLLHTAGNDVLFSLPQFDRRHGPSVVIDYSLTGSTQYHIGDIQGVSVEKINTYMSSVWLKSAMLARGGTKTTTDWQSRCLAEFETWSTPGGAYGNFRMRLGPPHVDILCAKEVIVYFNIDDLEFFKTDDLTAEPERKYTEWKIAMIVNVLYSSESDGHIVNISFDLSHARYHELASKFPGLEEDDGLAFEKWKLLITFFSDEYLQILQSKQYHSIYSCNDNWGEGGEPPQTPTHEDPNGTWGSGLSDKSEASSRETVQHAKMFEFDQVVAISQGSINAQFIALAANLQSIFSSWTYQDLFSASFKPMSIRFLSNNRAVIRVHIQSGHLKTLRDWVPCEEETADVTFGEWRLTFEVELKMCSQEKLMGAASEAYQNSSAYKKHGNQQDRDLRHIYLDICNAEYIHDHSTFRDTSKGGDCQSSIRELQAVLYYLTEHYFPEICKNAQNVISSVPVWKPGHLSPSYAFTSVAFQVYSKVEVTRSNWAHVTTGMDPIIVLFGMTGFRSLPSDHLDFSTGWIVQGNKGFSHGTISISKRVFIEERLLSLLSRVNALTTPIPTLNGADDADDAFNGFELVRWSMHDQRKHRPSKWKPQPSQDPGVLKYMWSYREQWRHDVSENSDSNCLERGITCITRNHVEFPIAVKQGALCIKVSGSVQVCLSVSETKNTTQSMQGMETQSANQLYTATSSVSWWRHLTLQTIGSVIKVNMLGSPYPSFADAEISQDSLAKLDPVRMLRQAFPDKVDLEELTQEINALEGAWQYYCPLADAYSLASPVFNDDGDILFELRRYSTANPEPAPVTNRMSSDPTTLDPASAAHSSSGE